VAQHFNIERAYKILLEVFGCNIFLGHTGLESLQLIQNYFIFFLFRLGFADALDELLELFGEVTGGRCHYVIRIRFIN
jgi:hypothetical protein